MVMGPRRVVRRVSILFARNRMLGETSEMQRKVDETMREVRRKPRCA